MKLDKSTYIISDLHFYHGNICKYCNRPYNVSSNNYLENKEELDRMNEDILATFDSLPDDCVVWNLGDVFYSGSNKKWLIENKYDEMKSFVSRMKGKNRKLYLVLGNHDDLHREGETRLQFYYSLGFDKVYDQSVVIDNYIFSHKPVYVNGVFKNLYGHTHDLDIKEDYFTYDYDNYAMIVRCCKQEGVEPPEIKQSFPFKTIDLMDYFNCCYDKHHKPICINNLRI